MLRIVRVEASSDELASVERVMVSLDARPSPAEDTDRVASEYAGAESLLVVAVVSAVTCGSAGAVGGAPMV